MSSKFRLQPPPSETGGRSPRGSGEDRSLFERGVTDMFDRFFAPVSPMCLIAERYWLPFTDIYESETHLLVRMELAGVELDSLEIVKEGTTLAIRGRRLDPLADRGLACHQLEISYGAFERVIALPEDFLKCELNAEHGRRTGFLEITIAKEMR